MPVLKQTLGHERGGNGEMAKRRSGEMRRKVTSLFNRRIKIKTKAIRQVEFEKLKTPKDFQYEFLVKQVENLRFR